MKKTINSLRGNVLRAARAKDGATIIGVLVALIFIGVVTATMLKTTTSQSGASRSHSTIMTDNVTVKSGIVATEAPFTDLGKSEGIRAMVEDMFKGTLGSKERQWTKVKHLIPNSANPEKDTLIEGSRVIFGRYDKAIPATQGSTKDNSLTAIKADDPARFGFGTATSKVEYAKNQAISSEKIAIWEHAPEIIAAEFLVKGGREETGRDIKAARVWGILDSVRLKSSGGGGVPPGVKGGLHSGAGLVTTGNHNLNVYGDVSVAGDLEIRDAKTNVNGTLHVSGDIVKRNQATATSTNGDPVKDIPAGSNAVFDISDIPSSVKYTLSSGINNQNMNSGLGKIVNDMFEKAKTENRLHNGHVVIEVANQSVIGAGLDQQFNGKAIFIVNGNWSVGGKFYNSGPDASTLVYVNAPNGRLDQFGRDAGGDFRGLVYVHPDNNNAQSFKWEKTNNIYGAIHCAGKGGVTWGDNGTMNIYYDPSAMQFGGGGKSVVFICTEGGVLKNPCPSQVDRIAGWKQFGVYFQ